MPNFASLIVCAISLLYTYITITPTTFETPLGPSTKLLYAPDVLPYLSGAQYATTITLAYFRTQSSARLLLRMFTDLLTLIWCLFFRIHILALLLYLCDLFYA